MENNNHLLWIALLVLFLMVIVQWVLQWRAE